MNEILSGSVYFGVVISIFAYWIGCRMQQKFKSAIVNPLLISIILIIAVLWIFRIDYETYDYGAKYITFLLKPATVCLAVPLYKQCMVLKKNLFAVASGVICGCVTHFLVIAGIAVVFKANQDVYLSMLPKSVTTPIALGICSEIGGIQAITVIGVCGAGIIGAVMGPAILKLFRIKEPIAQGLAMGTAAHAIGTSKAIEMGEVQGAMSSLAIVVTGLLTVLIIPLLVNYL